MEPAGRYQGVEKHSSGFKLLAAMGWKEGDGLGAKRQGMKEHVKVKRMQDKVGIGLAQATKKSRDWTIGMAAYDQVLAKLGKVGASAPQAGQKRKQAEAEAEAEAEAAEDPAEVHRKKKKKKRKGNSAEEPSPEAAAVSSAEGGVQTEVLAAASRAATADESPPTTGAKAAEALSRSSHLARFGRRRAGKNVRSYSGSDLAAILGGGSGPASEPEAAEQPAASELPAISDEAATASAMVKQVSQWKEATTAQEADPAQERWWHRHFVPAGRLGSKAADCQQIRPADAAPVKVKVAGFSEDDQAALYNLTQSGKTAGKQGLGVGKGPKKVAGARWQGTKTLLGGDSDAEQEAAAGAAAGGQQAGTEGAESEGSEDTHVSSHRAGEPAGQQRDPEDSGPAAPEAGPQPAGRREQPGEAASSGGLAVRRGLLRKLAASVLRAAGGRLRLKKLEKRVLDAAGLARGGEQRREAREKLRLALRKPRFSVLGDEAVLVS